jgi:hypothetical protein
MKNTLRLAATAVTALLLACPGDVVVYFPGGPEDEPLVVGIAYTEGIEDVEIIAQGNCRWYAPFVGPFIHNRYLNGTEWSESAEYADGSITSDVCVGEILEGHYPTV